MQISPSTYYTMVGTMVIMSAVLIGMILSYIVSFRKLRKMERKEIDIVSAAQKEAAEIISRANQIHDSSNTALNQAVDRLTTEEEAALTSKSREQFEAYEKKMNDINDSNIMAFKNMSNDLNSSIGHHFDELKNLLTQQTVQSQNIAQQKIKQEYEALEQELQDYKKAQLDKINHNIYQILLNVSRSVFGKALDAQGHEDAILKALEDAQKQMN